MFCQKCEKDACHSALIHSYGNYICPDCFPKQHEAPYFKTSDGVGIVIGDVLHYIDSDKDGELQVHSSKSLGYSDNYSDPPPVYELPKFIYEGSGASIALENGKSIYSDYLSSSLEAAIDLSIKKFKDNIKISKNLIEKKRKAYQDKVKQLKQLKESHDKYVAKMGKKKDKWTKALKNIKKLG
jgi:hypothetical protein